MPGSRKKGGWIKKNLGENIEAGPSKVVTEKRHVGLVMPDSAGGIPGPEAHVGVRVENRAERRYRKK